MHPATSVILFTTLSGAGYGLFIAIVIAFGFGWAAPNMVAIGLSFVLITAGLLSSTLHLGHPERAWRALSQWRTSWLSREGVLAILTFLPMGLFVAFVWLNLPKTWLLAVGSAGAAMCFLTVIATAMIYRSLKPIHAWHNPFTIPLYMMPALATGSTLLVIFNGGTAVHLMPFVPLVLSTTVQTFYWRYIDKTTSASTAESATGLGKFGKVSLFEAPHTESNYLMQEMGYQIARKHSRKLRRLFFILWVLTAILTGLSILIWPLALSICAALTAFVATLVQRWLFFAEAKHTVSLYYGAESA